MSQYVRYPITSILANSITNAMLQNSVGGIYKGSGIVPTTVTATITDTLLFAAGSIGVGILPTAKLHLRAGSATINTSPLKLTSGTNLTTAEAGAIEFDGTQLYFSPADVDRNILIQNSNATAFTAGSIPFATTSGYLTQANSNLFYNGAMNKLGVGTNTPITNLDISGNVRSLGMPTSVLTGSIDPVASVTVTGINTLFTKEIVVGDRIVVTGQTRTVLSITSDTVLTVDVAFSDNANDTTPDVLYALHTKRLSSGVLAETINDLGYLGLGLVGPTNKLEVFGTDSAGGVSSNIGYNITTVTGPGAATLTVVAGSGLEIGTYFYRIAFYNAIGDSSTPSSTSAITTAGNQQINLSNIPISTDLSVVGRRIFRGKVNEGSSYGFLIATIANNTATTHTDNFPDSSITGTLAARSIYAKPNLSSSFITINGTRALLLDANSTVVGNLAGQSLQTAGLQNCFFGAGAGRFITTGSENVFLGQNAGGYGVTAIQNVAIGQNALSSGTAPLYCIAMGPNTLRNNSNAHNIAMGYYTGNVSTGANNIFIGSYSGQSKVAGSENVHVGYGTGGYVAAHTSANIFLGNYAGGFETLSNTLIIDSINRANEASSRNGALLYGRTSATLASQRLSLGGGGRVGIGTTDPLSNLDVDGSIGARVTTVSINTTLDITHHLVKVDASGGAIVITLPAVATTNRRMYIIKKSDSSANTVTIDANAAELIDGSLTRVINTQYSGYMIQCDGLSWMIIAVV